MSDMQQRAAWIRKPGDGRTISVGDVLRLHARMAINEEDFDFEERLILSTYETGEWLQVTCDALTLLPEVLDAIVGQRTGVTLVVPLEARKHGVSGRAFVPSVETLLLEVWVEDSESRSEVGSQEPLARRPVHQVIDPHTLLANQLSEPTRQANGMYVDIPPDLQDLFDDLVDKVRSRHPALSIPHGLGDGGYVLQNELHEALRRELARER